MDCMVGKQKEEKRSGRQEWPLKWVLLWLFFSRIQDINKTGLEWAYLQIRYGILF